MFVYIARHAWAGEHGDPRWPDDSLRPLTDDGIERYTKVVQALADRGFSPQRIATSPYTRCRQTAEIIAAHVASRPTIEELSALEPGSDLADVVGWTNKQVGHDACWVGHSPDVEHLAAAMLSDGSANVRFAKGAVAAIKMDGAAAVGLGELYWSVSAKVLGL